LQARHKASTGPGWQAHASCRERTFRYPHRLIHQPSGGIGGSGSDIEIQMREMVKAKEQLARIISRTTGKLLDIVRKDIERDHWMDAEEAIEYGLVSKIIERRAELHGPR
jgi:ATP-dependent Clp protease, protease subunit